MVGLPADRSIGVDGLGAAGLKKLELAKALATGPKLLLADESLGGLDDTEMDQAADMLRKIRDELGITIIWVEHIMGVLMRVVDRVMVLDHARRFPMACRARCRTIRGWSRFISAPMPMPSRPPRPKRVVKRSAPMLELKSVDAGYGSFQALFGVSLDVKAGEAVGVIGPNGAGKTTLMAGDLRSDPAARGSDFNWRAPTS